MHQTLAVIHTSPTLAPMFGALCAQQMPDVKLFHMVDESLIKDTIRTGHLRRVTMRRLLSLVDSAEQAGATAVLVTCSSIGPAVAVAQGLFDVPVVRVDEAMAEQAVSMAKKIGVMATLKTTLEPTIDLLRAKAKASGRDVEIVSSLCDGAFAAWGAGDTATHDAILTKALLEDMKGVDVVVLAQASMARVLPSIPAGALKMPVLTSPELAVKQATKVLAGLAAEMRG
jgi:Asp/Glu/hydantoin racemase